MGTPNISGRYEGTYDVVVRKEGGKVQAYSGPLGGGQGGVAWSFDFSSEPKTVTLEKGRLTPAPGLPLPWLNYEARATGGGAALPLTDNGDGTYTVQSYVWQVFPVGAPLGPYGTTSITLEITQLLDDSIAVVTAQGAHGLPGTPLPSPPFPGAATPDWRGRASKV